MEEFKGTPGPWYAEADSANGITITDANEKEVAALMADNEDDLLTELEWDNARLLAAAPDLLEALILANKELSSLKLSMLAHPDCTEGSEFDDMTSAAQEAEDVAESAINKALGREVQNG